MTSLPTSLNDAVAAGQQAVSIDAALLAKLTDLAGDLAVNLTIASIILVATVIGARWAARLTRRGLLRVRAFRHDQTVLSFAVQVVRVVVYIVGFIAILQRLGVQTTSIIAVLGAASLAVGLALQGTLSNVAAGVLLLLLRPYKVGDVIDIGGVAGSVQRLDLFTTQMSNANNHKIVVPNSKVLGDVILNLSGQKTRRVEINFTVGYGEDLNAARAVLVGVAERHDKVLPDPAPWTGVTGLLDSAVQITLQAWVNSEDWWQTQADLMQGGKEAIDAAGIEIPFPHQVAVPYGDEDVMPVVTVRTAEQKARRAAGAEAAEASENGEG
ncbi:MAG: mechanosensitive ion channel family protein [Brevundimonas sp.]|uniref:mechanosensitive ion channel family protein n=1 Tax=Brevundimonas sp. TaxID=1871086 RepID=UPI002632335F|nr:mechanosensitive ion channel family protein [Brevundimonas sp.]MDI6623444.1 mechanosensitive ion channel family protein [Brevundimonas sp.]MDQ7811503.1 mechanosensitive ion channel family protein [Brevundimonas sp.]